MVLWDSWYTQEDHLVPNPIPKTVAVTNRFPVLLQLQPFLGDLTEESFFRMAIILSLHNRL